MSPCRSRCGVRCAYRRSFVLVRGRSILLVNETHMAVLLLRDDHSLYSLRDQHCKYSLRTLQQRSHVFLRSLFQSAGRKEVAVKLSLCTAIHLLYVRLT